eukprot:Gb_02169 [translate_table: standard]
MRVSRLQCLVCCAIELLTIALGSQAAFEADLVEKLPGQPQVSFKHYAGYVTVDTKAGRAFFYYFAESEKDPPSKPLVMWFNGGDVNGRKKIIIFCKWVLYEGPGCSSVGIGAFTEHGPFQPKKQGLVKNDYAWNKEANILYVESPAGVGFSYSNTSSDLNGANDTKTAEDNLSFLLNWFSKFPEYKDRELYLTGESYAGHYVPQLATLLLNYNKESKTNTFNFKGVAIGNPLLNFQVDMDSRTTFLWSHGLISDETYAYFLNSCNVSQLYSQSMRNNVSEECVKASASMENEVGEYVDYYDVTLDVCLQPQATRLSRTLGQTTDTVDVCLSDETTEYLNRADVQDALHANVTALKYPWRTCSRQLIRYGICSVLQYDELNREIPTIPLLQGLLQAGLRVLVYSGDQDSVIPFLSTRALIHSLGEQMKMNRTVGYAPWFQSGQVGGWAEEHGGQLCYASVRGAAHEVPFSQPARGLTLFQSFLSGNPPPLRQQ